MWHGGAHITSLMHAPGASCGAHTLCAQAPCPAHTLPALILLLLLKTVWHFFVGVVICLHQVGPTSLLLHIQPRQHQPDGTRRWGKSTITTAGQGPGRQVAANSMTHVESVSSDCTCRGAAPFFVCYSRCRGIAKKMMGKMYSVLTVSTKALPMQQVLSKRLPLTACQPGSGWV